jgi:molybdopterin-containing oxidoreductase family iron-sulfur binding subunit
MPPLKVIHEHGAEFTPAQAAPPDPSRRDFLQLLGASAALAGAATGCFREPPEHVLPYPRRPDGIVPGRPEHYATATTVGGFGIGLVVASHQGRPTKIEGNPEHPANLGGTGAIEQALLWSLYDPDRAGTITYQGQPRTARELGAWAREAAGERGDGVRFLIAPDASPLAADLRARIGAALPRARFISWAPTSDDAAYAGARLAFGQEVDVLPRLDRARIVVSLDADFLGRGPLALACARGFAAGRAPGPAMSRLYVAECSRSVTGGMADHRLAVRSGAIEGLAEEIARTAAAPLARALPRPAPLGEPATRFARAVARDLARHPGAGLVLAGPRQPPRVHALAHALNAALGNAGKTITYRPPVLPDAGAGLTALRDLVAEIRASKVKLLVVTAWNPIYAAPADLELAHALERVPEIVYLGAYEDETARAATWFVPAAHVLESWGDARAVDGTASIVQPLCEPLFGGVTAAELWAGFLGEGDRGARTLVRELWRREAERRGEPGDDFFARSLAAGVIPAREAPELRVAPNYRALGGSTPPVPAGSLELNFYPDAKVDDGRHAGNAWLQELPDPITKITWDNAALLSTATAGRLAIQTGDMLELTRRGRTIRAPAYVLPGHADDAISIALGYGRRAGESIGRGVGANAYPLRTQDALWFATDLTVRKTGERHVFAITQDHASMEGRPLALDDAEAAAAERGPLPSMYPQVPYPGYRWAMSIDLSRCTGCSACVIACQAENNIPVVGREGVRRGREMHWIRIDRYFEADRMITQPVACVHCEDAPCEYVCPVNATVHSDEGLNEMVYNRCVGTRYCSNNCPYKVRRFNFFDYTSKTGATAKMMQNPEVTVRSRGVMEKCTYCVQRIERARIDARLGGREIRDGEVRPACAQACPANAIEFGSLHDPAAAVSRAHADPRRYDLLHDLGTRPRTAYLARARNLNPELG